MSTKIVRGERRLLRKITRQITREIQRSGRAYRRALRRAERDTLDAWGTIVRRSHRVPASDA